jgi:hypothetical protein
MLLCGAGAAAGGEWFEGGRDFVEGVEEGAWGKI